MDRSFRKEKDGVHITGFQSNYSNWENEGMVTSFFLCILREEVILITQKEVNIVFNEQVRLCEDTMQKKTREYTGDEEDRLCAFKAAAALLHTTPERALAGMMAKHIVSLYDMCFDDGGIYDMDIWEEKITDSLNYLFLLKAVVKEGCKDRQS